LSTGVEQGDFVEVRGRQWLVEAINDAQLDLTTVKLSCIADDAQGEQIEVLWDAEIGARVLEEDAWSSVGRGAPDSPEVLAAYVKAGRSGGLEPPTPGLPGRGFSFGSSAMSRLFAAGGGN
jgi:hypothetical protein